MRSSTRYALTCSSLLVAGSLFVVSLAFSRSAPQAQTAAPPSNELSQPQPARVSEIQGYKEWAKVNPQPVPIVSKVVAIMCARPTADDRAHDVSSPHADKLITVYVNELGRRAMMNELKPTFAVGSVIVKEKRARENEKKGEPDEPELLTVMIKRERGFNPAVGDWEFMATNGAGTKVDARGKLESCQACHAMMKETDFVSRSYLPDELRSKLR
jgi:Cytochrome P460